MTFTLLVLLLRCYTWCTESEHIPFISPLVEHGHEFVTFLSHFVSTYAHNEWIVSIDEAIIMSQCDHNMM